MKRRAISDIIAVLLLLGITVAGAVLVSTFFQGSNLLRFDSSNSGTQTSGLKLTGYDTRDTTDLSGISSVDNTLGGGLTSGEFIVLNVDNKGITKVGLQAVQINGIDHSWDLTTTGALNPGTIPDGEFSIISASGTTRIPNGIERNEEVRLVIKLDPDINPGIVINDPIRIKFFTDLIDDYEIIIKSGGIG